jgi:hypothetical protein
MPNLTALIPLVAGLLHHGDHLRGCGFPPSSFSSTRSAGFLLVSTCPSTSVGWWIAQLLLPGGSRGPNLVDVLLQPAPTTLPVRAATASNAPPPRSSCGPAALLPHHCLATPTTMDRLLYSHTSVSPCRQRWMALAGGCRQEHEVFVA